ncbi:MAG TPA: Slp/YeaY family lipoprotein [Gammaproteobacteria bacterium]|nr:Slp/YeaY family lipoprotein [Gammaproteobacteria bacterium]
MVRFLPLFAALLLLAACAGGPRLETTGVMHSVTPAQAAAEFPRLQGTRVLWGGRIVSSRNDPESTRLEVLAYPLDRSQRPRLDSDPQGRFLAVKAGYLETADYAPGRAVTLTGELVATEAGRIGEADYTFPKVRVNQLHLWPERRRAQEPRFHFGIGVIFGN